MMNLRVFKPFCPYFWSSFKKHTHTHIYIQHNKMYIISPLASTLTKLVKVPNTGVFIVNKESK